jgi:hypothetical protein
MKLSQRTPRTRVGTVRLLPRQHWRQSFPFSCGPAALGSLLMMLGWKTTRSRTSEELDLWREATAVACPGAHPLGLALTARRRGFVSEVRIDGNRPWLREHVLSAHALLGRRDYSRVERSLVRECRELGIPVRWGADVPREGQSGLLLVTARADPGTKPDPHWIGLLATDKGLWVTDPARSRPYRSAQSLAEWWAVSGFAGTKSWVGIGGERVGFDVVGRPPPSVSPSSRSFGRSRKTRRTRGG